MKTLLNIISILTIGAGLVFTSTAGAQTVRDISNYNNEQGDVALLGYDPVSYFKEGGARPILGDAKIALNYMGINYHFANLKNLEVFKLNANKYEPTYGGYCAYAMASGAKVQIDPLVYTIHGNRAHFFVSNRAKIKFDADVAGFETKADDFWKMISGETPRL
jgi:YHS domain-containing protein